MSAATIEKTHQINPTGQTGIWKHSQNVDDDLLKRFVVQVQTRGWLSMKSYDSLADAVRYALSGTIERFVKTAGVIRIWDDSANAAISIY